MKACKDGRDRRDGLFFEPIKREIDASYLRKSQGLSNPSWTSQIRREEIAKLTTG